MPKKSIAKTNKDDQVIDSMLRPSSWQDYIGQEHIKKGLRVILAAAKKRNESSDHLLFYGQAGLGKTTLANLIAKEMNANLKIASGPTLEKVGDIVATLSNLENGDILFIDEAHRLNRVIEEALYPAMESRKIHIIIGKGPASRTICLDLPPFTLIAATTRPNLLSSPLRSRFGAAFRLDYYEVKDIEIIIKRSAEILGIGIDLGAVSIIANASRFTPRIANRLLKRSRDFAEVNNINMIDSETAYKTLNLLEIDKIGLEIADRQLLEAIIKKFNGGPVGASNLAAAIGEDKEIIEEVFEPYLIRIGMIQRTSSGRVATEKAYKHLRNVKHEV
ncbi:MAG TPA: Holliday junction branch migration DNA helicase RuvB [Candidatus Wolfebacteria bacterium]|nr:Holliday junction branch migration DNA helicase RuvB [Candidatus Wolfebacteria bacterium]